MRPELPGEFSIVRKLRILSRKGPCVCQALEKYLSLRSAVSEVLLVVSRDLQVHGHTVRLDMFHGSVCSVLSVVFAVFWGGLGRS